MDLLTTYTHTRLGTTSSYSATANLYSSQITKATAKSFPACCVFISRSPATASNSGDSSASRPQVTELTWSDSESESESYITTDGQSASLSWNKAPVWGLWPDFYYCQTVGGLLIWGAFSLTRGQVCRLQLLLALASAVFLGSESRGTRDHILLSQIRDSPPTTRRVTVEVLDPASIAFSDLVALIVLKITPRHGPRRNTLFSNVLLLFRVDLLLRERVYRAVA
jgi:hypothetical protein